MSPRAPISRVYDFRKPGPRFKVVRPIGVGKILFTILSTSVWGCQTHFDPTSKRTFGCTGSACVCASRKIPSREKGYLHVINADNDEQFLELTPTAVAELFRQLGTKERSLRGLMGWVRRSNGTVHGRIEMMILERTADPEKLPDEKDPEPVLRNLWGMA
jgi:hypothetical protein